MDENRASRMWGVVEKTGGKRTEWKYAIPAASYAVFRYPEALSN